MARRIKMTMKINQIQTRNKRNRRMQREKEKKRRLRKDLKIHLLEMDQS
jgi:hypothetical protein